MKTFLVIFQDTTGLRLFSCKVHTNGDRDRAIKVAIQCQPHWYQKCEQISASELTSSDAKAPNH